MQKLINEYGLDKKYDVQIIASVDECLADLDVLAGMETVFLSGIHSHERNIILKYCIANEIGVFAVPRIGDTLMSAAVSMHMFHLPMLRVGRYMASPEYLFMKRKLDIVLSLMAIVLTSPIMLVTAVAIKLTDGGPVFYKKVRLTKDGARFDMIKFRSMKVDAEKTAWRVFPQGIMTTALRQLVKLFANAELTSCRSFCSFSPERLACAARDQKGQKLPRNIARKCPNLPCDCRQKPA